MRKQCDEKREAESEDVILLILKMKEGSLS